MASSPGHRHPHRQAGGGGTNRRLRPIPLSSEGVRGRSSTASGRGPARGSRAELRRTSSSSGSSTSRPDLVHKPHPDLHRRRAPLLTTGPDQSACRPSLRPARRRGGRARKSNTRNVRRALIGMSDKGPSLDVHRTGVLPRRRPVLVTLPVDPAGSSDPDDLATWPSQPLVGKPPRHCADLRLRPIPSLPEEGREESSIAPRPGTTRGFTTFLSHTSGSGESSTMCPRSSTDRTPDLHRAARRLVERPLVRMRAVRRPRRPRADADRHRTAPRPGHRWAGRRRSVPPAARWQGTRSR